MESDICSLINYYVVIRDSLAAHDHNFTTVWTNESIIVKLYVYTQRTLLMLK